MRGHSDLNAFIAQMPDSQGGLAGEPVQPGLSLLSSLLTEPPTKARQPLVVRQRLANVQRERDLARRTAALWG
ncbi:MAG: hypothetical protein ACPGOY_00480 [Rhodospirillaceae bacterium]